MEYLKMLKIAPILLAFERNLKIPLPTTPQGQTLFLPITVTLHSDSRTQ